MNPQHLLQSATELATRGVGKPRQADLRRALSTVYYAMFHYLSKTYADAVVGRNTKRNNRAWYQAYRSLTHSQVAQCCNRTNVMRELPQKIQDFGHSFVKLQMVRINADYNPYFETFRSSVIGYIQLAEDAINDFSSADLRDRKAFAILATTKYRDLDR